MPADAITSWSRIKLTRAAEQLFLLFDYHYEEALLHFREAQAK